MKIEFWYDPVNPETMLKLEDRWLDKDDIYGFLYSVQSLPLQNWLYASGSWPGLKAHLSDLTRGEELTLIFFGRECDFEDLKTCLDGMPDLELFFEPWDVFGICKSRLAELPGVVEKLGLPESPFPELACCSIQEETEAGWICSIENETQFREACRREGDCCAVSGQYLTSFEKLETLKQLTSSLKRPEDSILCIFSGQERRKQFADYAAMYPDCRYSFVMEGDTACRERLREKYGTAFSLRNRMRSYRNLYQQMEKCFRQKEALERQMREIELACGRDSDRYVSDTVWEDCRRKLEWAERKRTYVKDLCRLVYTQMTEDVELKYKEMGL